MLFPFQTMADGAALSAPLRSAIETAYRVFAGNGPPLPLRVCRCPSCVDAETARRLVSTPLRALPSRVLEGYTSSGHLYEEARDGATLRHYLPRYLELIALNDPPAPGMDLPQSLRRLGDAGYRTAWAAEEVEAIDRVLDALLLDKLADLSVIEWPEGPRLGYPMDDLLEMAVLAGGDLGRILATFAGADDPGYSLHVAGLADRLRFHDGRVEFWSVILENDAAARRAIGAFLAGRSNVARMERSFFRLDGEPALQRILSRGLQIVEVFAAVPDDARDP